MLYHYDMIWCRWPSAESVLVKLYNTSIVLGWFAIPETCEIIASNSCFYYAHQTHEIYQILPYSVDFKAPKELWNPLSKTVLSLNHSKVLWYIKPGVNWVHLEDGCIKVWKWSKRNQSNAKVHIIFVFCLEIIENLGMWNLWVVVIKSLIQGVPNLKT